MIVIDIGCAKYGGDYSIEHLLKEFSPDVLYGFDPSSGAMQEWMPALDTDTKIVLERKAAWIFDGEIAFFEDGLNSHIGEGDQMVPCFDLAKFIRETITAAVRVGGHGVEYPEVVLKLDCESAEYALLEHLIEDRVDALLKLVWVEWHDFGPDGREERRRRIEDRIACPLEEWNH